jgi:hypothetical protein
MQYAFLGVNGKEQDVTAPEQMGYFQDGAWLLGTLNVTVMVAACLAAGMAGLASARWLVGS